MMTKDPTLIIKMKMIFVMEAMTVIEFMKHRDKNARINGLYEKCQNPN